jgi:hypothetical protein
MVFCAGLLLFAGCKDLFHPDGPGNSLIVSGISGITYSSVSGGTWNLESGGKRRSPTISHNGITKARVSFTSTMANANITIQLDVSSEEFFDIAFIGELDNPSSSAYDGYYTRISGEKSIRATIPVPAAGSHFIDIGYRKDELDNDGSDCAWFMVINGAYPSIIPISGITYSSVSGGTWILESDGTRRSPTIGHNSVTKMRVSFTSNVANASITILLAVSSEEGYDYAFISTLDNPSATYNNGYYSGSRISGMDPEYGFKFVGVTIPVPTAGSHFIDIGYQKDGSDSGYDDCAWFIILD